MASTATSRAPASGNASTCASRASSSATRSRASGTPSASPVDAQRRRMPPLQHLAVAEVHVHAAREARIETAYRAHDVDAFEVGGPVLFEDRRTHHRVFIWSAGAETISRTPIPRRRRIGMVVGDLAIANHHVMRQHAPHCFVEAAADRFVRNLELLEYSEVARADVGH